MDRNFRIFVVDSRRWVGVVIDTILIAIGLFFAIAPGKTGNTLDGLPRLVPQVCFRLFVPFGFQRKVFPQGFHAMLGWFSIARV